MPILSAIAVELRIWITRLLRNDCVDKASKKMLFTLQQQTYHKFKTHHHIPLKKNILNDIKASKHFCHILSCDLLVTRDRLVSSGLND